MSNAVCNAVTNGVRISSRPEPDQNQIVLTAVRGVSGEGSIHRQGRIGQAFRRMDATK